MNGRIPPRTIIIAVVATLVGLLLLNGAYTSGVADGMIQAGRVGSGAVVPGGVGPGGFGPVHGATFGLGWGFGLVFGLIGFIVKLAFLLLIIALIARFVFGRRFGPGGHGPWSGRNPFEEWHRRAHQAEAPVNPAGDTL